MHSHYFATFVSKWVHPDNRACPVQAQEMDRVEARLQTSLPMSYRQFMESIGPVAAELNLLSEIVDQGLDLDDLQEFYAPEVIIEQTEVWREIGLPDTLVAFAAQGAGDLYCFEVVPKTSTVQEDATVWYFDHEGKSAYNLEVKFVPWIAQYAEVTKTEA